MARYLLHQWHTPDERGVVFASFRGHHSPLRLLPYHVAERTAVTGVSEIQIP